MLSPRLVISFYFGGDLPPGLFFGGPNSSLFGGHNQFLRYRDTESQYVHPRILLLEEATVKSSVIKRSVVIGGHKTTISLEEQFWSILKEIAQAQGATLAQTLTEIDKTREHTNRSSAIRLFVLGHVRDGRNGSIALAT